MQQYDFWMMILAVGFAAFSRRDKTLRQKHPDAKPSNDTMMLHGPFSHVN